MRKVRKMTDRMDAVRQNVIQRRQRRRLVLSALFVIVTMIILLFTVYTADAGETTSAKRVVLDQVTSMEFRGHQAHISASKELSHFSNIFRGVKHENADDDTLNDLKTLKAFYNDFHKELQRLKVKYPVLLTNEPQPLE